MENSKDRKYQRLRTVGKIKTTRNIENVLNIGKIIEIVKRGKEGWEAGNIPKNKGRTSWGWAVPSSVKLEFMAEVVVEVSSCNCN